MKHFKSLLVIWALALLLGIAATAYGNASIAANLQQPKPYFPPAPHSTIVDPQITISGGSLQPAQADVQPASDINSYQSQ